MSTPAPHQTSRQPLGLPWWAIAGLAMLGAPRVVLHDLDVATSGPLAGLLTLGPPAAWIVVTLRARCPRPLVTLLAVGVLHGGILAIGHQLFWDEVFDDLAPGLGGNLEGRLSPTLEDAIFRVVMTVNSIFTGAAVGLVCGLLALTWRALVARAPRR